METKGLILVHTGDGKGKTTAGLGLALRAWGSGLRVLILQFIKGGWKYGELEAIERLGQLDGRIEIRPLGLGLMRSDEDREKHIRAAAKALQESEQMMVSGQYDLIIFDEINYAVKFGLISILPSSCPSRSMASGSPYFQPPLIHCKISTRRPLPHALRASPSPAVVLPLPSPVCTRINPFVSIFSALLL